MLAWGWCAVVALIVSARAPERLSQTGLNAREVRSFAPQYPLWSDGATKRRWVALPGPIDARDMDAWEVPIGTRFWKEFALDGVKVETRMITRVSADDWDFATYRWNADGTDAERVEDGARVRVGDKMHEIPRIDDCRACHEAGRSPVLGFTALQLSDDRDPLAPHAEVLDAEMTTLSRLMAEEMIAGPETVAMPRIEARSARERAVMGYLGSNCGTCHNGDGPLATLEMDLAHGVVGSTVDVPGRWRVPGIAQERSRRIAPAEPEASAIVARMRSRWPASQMPPLGTRVVDREALALIEAWIAEDLRRSGP